MGWHSDFLPGAARFAVRAGWVVVEVAKWNLAAATDAGMDSDESELTMEKIRLRISPFDVSADEMTVIKHWPLPEA